MIIYYEYFEKILQRYKKFDNAIHQTHLGMRRRKSPKFDFQSQFSMSKISFIILIFVSVKIIRLGVQLMIYQFLITSFFEVVYFLKLGPIFVASYPSERKSNHKNN